MHTPHSRSVRIETIHELNRYTHGRIERARTIAELLGREQARPTRSAQALSDLDHLRTPQPVRHDASGALAIRGADRSTTTRRRHATACDDLQLR
jgi:hypothetical protein